MGARRPVFVARANQRPIPGNPASSFSCGWVAAGHTSGMLGHNRWIPWLRRGLTTACVLGLVACAGTPTSNEQGTTLKLPFKQSGAGQPTVVFEAGAGEQWATWDKVLPEVNNVAHTFAYTRRGYSGLPVLAHRDAVTIVDELRTLLREQHVEPPYILVGHSLGGLYMQVFAKHHPEEVAGIVLVDTTHPDQFARMKTERRGSYWLAQTMMTLNGATTVSAEMRAVGEVQKQWHAAGPLPEVPTIVLSAMRDTSINGPEFTQFMQQLHRELVASWRGAELRMVDSDHFIQRNRPEDVVQAIRDVLGRVAPDARKAYSE